MCLLPGAGVSAPMRRCWRRERPRASVDAGGAGAEARGKAERGNIHATDGPGRLPAGAELHHPARRPGGTRTVAHRLPSPDYYQHIARVLEAGQVRSRLLRRPAGDAGPATASDHAHTVEHGIRCVKLDPIVVLMMMGVATERLGLGATYSTTYYEPFHVARLFADARPDDARGAPPGTSSPRSTTARPRNMGRDEVIDARPALRPRRRVHGGRARPLGHLGRRRAIVDKATGRFADADKVHRLDHVGQFFRRAGRSRCRARRRATRWSSRPARAGAASASPRAGAS